MTKVAIKTIAVSLLATLAIPATGCYYDHRDDYYGRRYDGRYDRYDRHDRSERYNDRRDNDRWRDRDRWRQEHD